MIIENVDALKSWLAKLLEPICEADPSALANYVVALVKKDKPEKELKALCADQLDVFLQKETVKFVDSLFESLTTKNYLGNPAAKEAPKEEVKPAANKAETPEEERENRRRRSPLRNRPDLNESRQGYFFLTLFIIQLPPPLLPLPTPPHPFSSASSSAGVSGAGGVPIVTPAHLPDSTTDSWSIYYSAQRQDGIGKPFSSKNTHLKQRCRDYDEKGFCVRGDLCPFDHGNDPLIVDDVTLPKMIPFPPPPVMPPAGLPMPPITEPPPSLRLPVMPPYPQPPPPGVFPMTGPPLIATSGIDTPNHQSAITSSPPIGPPGVGLPPTLPPPPPPVPPQPPSSSSSVSLRPQYVQSEYNYDPEGYNPESPGLTGAGRNSYRQFIPRVQSQRSNLIGLTSSEGQVCRGKNRFRSRISDQKETQTQSQNKNVFPKRNHYVNTKLEVRKIPRELNNITKLNEHFSKFGTIVNIQVVFGGDPEAALIQYTKNEEARRAISSTQAVLNNRFIRVYWHREPCTNTAGQEQNPGTQGPASAPGQGLQHGNMHKVPPNTQKGPFPATAPKSSSKSLGKTGKALEAQEAMKKKQEAMKLQQDMRKKKQEMLKAQIDCQKVLINRLEKNRTMKPEERANIMKTLKELTEKITQLQNEMNPSPQVSSGKTPHNQPKTKTDAQKELLDAELDFHKKMSSGEDTTDLKRKLGQLQVEAKRLGLIPPTGRGRGRGKMALDPGAMHMGRGRSRSREMMARGGVVNRMVVDHRTRTLAILGVTQEEKEELMPHFVTRGEAENAANQGAKFKGRVLQISWYKPKTSSVTSEPEVEEAKDEEKVRRRGEDEEEEEDDDEDDEYESRSWRR
uniref:RNA binding motif protein 27 n=1 Tax=Cyprinodon variegatus TaxID=28743 RepID=A0A3Q2D1R1_CYPVA